MDRTLGLNLAESSSGSSLAAHGQIVISHTNARPPMVDKHMPPTACILKWLDPTRCFFLMFECVAIVQTWDALSLPPRYGCLKEILAKKESGSFRVANSCPDPNLIGVAI